MKILTILVTAMVICTTVTFAQKIEREMPKGYEQAREGIAKGKIDTLLYDSKMVGNKRKTLVYTPPNFDKKKKYPVFYLLHGIGGDHLNGSKEQTHKIF